MYYKFCVFLKKTNCVSRSDGSSREAYLCQSWLIYDCNPWIRWFWSHKPYETKISLIVFDHQSRTLKSKHHALSLTTWYTMYLVSYGSSLIHSCFPWWNGNIFVFPFLEMILAEAQWGIYIVCILHYRPKYLHPYAL